MLINAGQANAATVSVNKKLRTIFYLSASVVKSIW